MSDFKDQLRTFFQEHDTKQLKKVSRIAEAFRGPAKEAVVMEHLHTKYNVPYDGSVISESPVSEENEMEGAVAEEIHADVEEGSEEATQETDEAESAEQAAEESHEEESSDQSSNDGESNEDGWAEEGSSDDNDENRED